MRTSTTTIQGVRAGITVVLAVLMLLMPLTSLAQDATPTDMDTSAELTAQPAQSTQLAAIPGSLQVTLTSWSGLGLSGSVAVTDSAGVYQEVWVSEGFGQAASLAAGTATVTQLTGTTDYAIDATPKYIEIPEGGIGYATITNAFLDADGDGVGDSVDACPAGNDAIDTDGDGLADACDTTPNGDPTPPPTTQPTAVATIAPTATATPASTPVAGKTNRSRTAAPVAANSQVAGCSPVFATNKTAPGTFLMYRCSTNGSRLSFSLDVRANRWKLAYVLSHSATLQPSDFAFESLPWKPGESASLPMTDTDGHKNVYIFVTPMESAAIGVWGDFPQFQVQLRNGNQHFGSPFFQFFRDITPNDFSLSCSPAQVTPDAAGIATVTCQVAWVSKTQNPDARATFKTPVVPAGWKVLGPTEEWQLKEWNLKYGTPFAVTFRIQRQASAPDTSLTVSVNAVIEAGTYIYPGLSDSFTIGDPSPQPSFTEVTASESVFGGTTNLSAKVSPAGVNGTVAFKVNGILTPAPAYNVSTGVATLTGFAHGLAASDTPYRVEAIFTPTVGSKVTKEATLLVRKAPATLSLSNQEHAYDGAAKTATVTTHPASISGVTITYNGATDAPVNPGTYRVVATLTNPNHFAAPVEADLTITTASTRVENISATESTWGGTTDLSAKVSPAGVPGRVEFFVNGSAKAASGTVSYDPATGIATLTGYVHNLSASTTPYSVRAVFTPSGDTHTGSEATNESALLVEHEPLRISNLTAQMSWSHPYSFDEFSQTGWIEYTVSGTAEKGWTVQVTASDFGHSGGGKPIPADSLHFATASTTPGAGIETPATSGSLGSGPIVLSGSGETPPGPYTQTLDLTMNVPGGTPVGIYVSTITITASAAP